MSLINELKDLGFKEMSLGFYDFNTKQYLQKLSEDTLIIEDDFISGVLAVEIEDNRIKYVYVDASDDYTVSFPRITTVPQIKKMIEALKGDSNEHN